MKETAPDSLSASAKLPPFKVLRSNRESLVSQVMDGLRRAMASGFYRKGDILPRAKDMADHLGVSFTVMRAALAKLTAEGLINPRRHVGTVVVGAGTPVYQGRVLMVLPDGDDCFYQNIVVGELGRRLSLAGYLFVQEVVRVRESGHYDFTHLDFSLSLGTDLVIQLFDRPEISRHLTKVGAKWLLIGDGPKAPRGCAGLIHVRRMQAMDDFARHCRRAGVRRVLQVGVLSKDADAVPALRTVGISASEWLLHEDGTFQSIEAVQRCTVEAFERRFFARGRTWLPDLIFFKDDFVATAGMLVLLRHGVRVPEDVKVVTWANKDLGPVYSVPYTRMEMDPAAHGVSIAGWVLRFLRTGKLTSRAHVGPVYLVGQTFA